MKKLYTTTVNVTGGREGHAKSLDGNLDVDLVELVLTQSSFLLPDSQPVLNSLLGMLLTNKGNLQ